MEKIFIFVSIIFIILLVIIYHLFNKTYELKCYVANSEIQRNYYNLIFNYNLELIESLDTIKKIKVIESSNESNPNYNIEYLINRLNIKFNYLLDMYQMYFLKSDSSEEWKKVQLKVLNYILLFISERREFLYDNI